MLKPISIQILFCLAASNSEIQLLSMLAVFSTAVALLVTFACSSDYKRLSVHYSLMSLLALAVSVSKTGFNNEFIGLLESCGVDSLTNIKPLLWTVLTACVVTVCVLLAPRFKKTGVAVLIVILLLASILVVPVLRESREINKLTASPANAERFLYAIHEDSFKTSACRDKYATSGPLMNKWESNSAIKQHLNLECVPVAQSMIRKAFRCSSAVLFGILLLMSINVFNLLMIAPSSSSLNRLFVVMRMFSAVFVLLLRLKPDLSIDSSFSQMTSLFSSKPIPNRLVTSVFANKQSSFMVVGRFESANCKNSPVSMYVGKSHEQTIVRSRDCSFSFLADWTAPYFTYESEGLTNKVDLKRHIITSKKRIDLGVLSVARSIESKQTRVIQLYDLLTDKPIQSARIKVLRNLDASEVGVFDAKDGQVHFEVPNGYYSVIIEADGFRPAKISEQDLLRYSHIERYLLKDSFGSNMIELRSPGGKQTLSVRFTKAAFKYRCTVDKFNPVCPQAVFISKQDSLNDISMAFIVYNSETDMHVLPVLSKTPVHQTKDNKRLLTVGRAAVKRVRSESHPAAARYFGHLEVSGAEGAGEASSSCVEDWATGICIPNQFSKTITVSVTMSDYLVYSPNVTCIRPTVIENQSFKVLRFLGKDDAVWTAIFHNQTFFILISDDESKRYPAEIYGPKRVIVQVLSKRAQRVAQHATMFATITTSATEYFNIDLELWSNVEKVAISSSPLSELPEVEITSSNTLNLQQSLSKNILNRISIAFNEVKGMDQIRQAVESHGEVVRGKVYTSQRGYRPLSLPSATKDAFDTYRVCVYCLKKESRLNKFTAKVGEDEFDYSSIRYANFTNNLDLMEAFFRKLEFNLPHNTFIDEDREVKSNVVIKTEDQEFKVISKQVLLQILNNQLAGSLNNNWFTMLSFDSVNDRKYRAPKVASGSSLYIFHRGVAKQYLAPEQDAFEPSLTNVLDHKLSDAKFGGDGLKIERGELNRIWRQGKTYQGLFVKSNRKGAHPAWPYHMTKVDGVAQKYYLNLGEVRNALGLPPVPGYQPTTVQDNRTKTLFDSVNEDMIVKEVDQLENPHIVNINGNSINLTLQCIDAFFKAKVANSFIPVKKWTSKQPANRFFVQLGNPSQVYIFRLQGIMDAIEQNIIKNETLNETIHTCLELETISIKSNAYRIITVDTDNSYEGHCDGEFRNNSECSGLFRGDHYFKRKPKSSSSKFHCYGILNKKGCDGMFKRLVLVNSSLYQLESEGQSTPTESVIHQSVSLSNKTNKEDTQISCSQAYDIDQRVCNNSILRHNSNKSQLITLESTCSGSFLLEKFKCLQEEFTMTYCRQEVVLEDSNQCNGTYIRRVCKQGGTFDGCDTADSDNIDIICDGGFWDGSVCKIKPVHIIINDQDFYTGVFDGDYTENQKIEGQFDARLIKCDRDITPDDLCEAEADKKFRCNGLTTKQGCKGVYKSTTVVNASMVFDVTIKTEDFVDTNLEVTRGTTTLSHYSNDGKKSVTVSCARNYSEAQRNCGDAVYQETIKREDTSTDSLSIICKGVLNLETLACSADQFNRSYCSTRFPNPAPICNGTYSGLRCPNGGSYDKCNGKSPKNRKIRCESGMWDGSICRPRPLHIILNNVAYVTGTCEGVYTENESCEGKLNGSVILCKPNLTSDNLCSGLSVDYFVCEGTITRDGCKGKYSSTGKIRNANLSIETPPESIMLVNKSLVDGAASAKYLQSARPWKSEYYGWETLKGDCGEGFSVYHRVCPSGSAEGVQQYQVNKTYISGSCDGKLNLNTFSCDSGKYSAKFCNTTITPQDADKCNGTYVDVACNDGGSLDGCFVEEVGNGRIYCDGVYSYDSKTCDPWIAPKPSIIRINETHWLKGKCSASMQEEECNGEFTEGVFVSCSGDPTRVSSDFDNCKPIKGETFGVCKGKLNKQGCTGEYSHPIIIDRVAMEASFDPDYSSSDCIYNFSTFSCHSHVTSKDEMVDYTFDCKQGFNVKQLVCPGYNSKLFNRKAAPKVPGSTLRSRTTCLDGNYFLDTKICSIGHYEHESCLGRSHILRSNKMTCLGDYFKTICVKGGQETKCPLSTLNDIGIACRKNYFDGLICSSTKPSSNSDIRIRQIDTSMLKDASDHEQKICNFEIDSFTMNGATVKSSQIINNVVKSLKLATAVKLGDGSLTQVSLLDQRYTMSFDEGTIESMTFENFMLDELKYQNLATDDSCKLVKVRFIELNIENAMINGFSSKRSVIRTVQFNDKEKLEDFGVESIDSKLAFGRIIMRNIELYLPYISNRTIERWIESEFEGKRETHRVVIPRFQEISIPPYEVSFKDKSTEIYLNFPQFIIRDKSMDITLMDEYLLSSDTLKAQPKVVSSILENYVEDPHIQQLLEQSDE